MAYQKHTWTCDEDITANLLNHMEEGIENAGEGGGGGSVILHEMFASVENVPAGGSAYKFIPMSEFGASDPNEIVIVSCEWNDSGFRSDNPGSQEIVPGYSIQRGDNFGVRVIATSRSGAYATVPMRLVYTLITE